jgi:hypothetical protein
MTPEPHYVEDANLSVAWAKALMLLAQRGGPHEIAPLIVGVTSFKDDVPAENRAIRQALDATLTRLRMQTCETVAGTIFPTSLWNPNAPRAHLFARYNRITSKAKQLHPQNRRGMYFERLTTGGPDSEPNQLEFILSNFEARAGVRRSALQIAVFDPRRDHSSSALLGFPCLQHVTFAPAGTDALVVNAFYATQYMVERAYGNYLGLCRLGAFVARELGRRLTRVTCFSGIGMLDVGRTKLGRVLEAASTALDAPVQPGSDGGDHA